MRRVGFVAGPRNRKARREGVRVSDGEIVQVLAHHTRPPTLDRWAVPEEARASVPVRLLAAPESAADQNDRTPDRRRLGRQRQRGQRGFGLDAKQQQIRRTAIGIEHPFARRHVCLVVRPVELDVRDTHVSGCEHPSAPQIDRGPAVAHTHVRPARIVGWCIEVDRSVLALDNEPERRRGREDERGASQPGRR